MITIDSLTKKQRRPHGRRRQLVRRLQRPGHRLPGPNGAGKSTSMRMMVGLTTPTEGTATISWSSFADLLMGARSASCSTPLLSTPAAPAAVPRPSPSRSWASWPPGRSARRTRSSLAPAARRAAECATIRWHAPAPRHRGCLDRDSLGAILDAANGPPGWYSAGCATCWARRRRRRTVPLLLRLLTEIEIIADDIVMIGRGGSSARARKAELLRLAGTVVVVEIPALQRALAAAASSPSTRTRSRTEAETAQVGRAAYDGGVVLTELRTADSGGLDEMFELTAIPQRESHTERQRTTATTSTAPPPGSSPSSS